MGSKYQVSTGYSTDQMYQVTTNPSQPHPYHSFLFACYNSNPYSVFGNVERERKRRTERKCVVLSSIWLTWQITKLNTLVH